MSDVLGTITLKTGEVVWIGSDLDWHCPEDDIVQNYFRAAWPAKDFSGPSHGSKVSAMLDAANEVVKGRATSFQPMPFTPHGLIR